MDYKNYTIDIQQDEDTEDPLSWTTPEERGAWLVLNRRHYNLPNELNVDFDSYDSWKEVAEGESKTLQVYKFVDWYEHGGVVLTLQDTDTPRDQWDSGIAGVIIGNSEQEIQNVFSSYKAYIEGEVYGYIIKDKAGEEVESLWGIYGYDEAMEEARAYIDNLSVSTGQTK